MLLKLGKRRLVTDVFKDVAVAITFAANGKGGVSCCCSAQERCLDQGCSFQPYIEEAMRLVLKASEMSVGGVLREHGIVFVSSSSAFSEAFLFELAVNLSRNGSSLRSSAYLREGFNELTAALS
ncbi:hypothetical protein I4F81_010352 [Pyropia yezoensis]|uniref:Uncharacterized protein n=1 Tax=Pyropia yezoensis TaxID=2788 RepID=A0ACC3CCH3_PYRYE|nr:hypothetical protein I4F81_010352 [Neopyropia yezoensis]